MPYEWTTPLAVPERFGPAPDGGPRAAPLVELRLWPHRSMPLPGFAGFFGATAALAALPLLAVLGSPVLWGLLPFVALALSGLWWAIRSTYRSAEVLEEMRLWPDRVELVRHEPRGERSWAANPHWVRTALHTKGGPVPHYLTLSGSGRTVEIGAFLSADERIALRPEIEDALRTALGRSF